MNSTRKVLLAIEIDLLARTLEHMLHVIASKQKLRWAQLYTSDECDCDPLKTSLGLSKWRHAPLNMLYLWYCCFSIEYISINDSFKVLWLYWLYSTGI